MNRKVIKQGNNTLTVTLPKEWTKKNGIEAGDEISVVEKGKELAINSPKAMPLSNIEIDITGMDGSSIVLLIRGLYRRGYDKIVINTKDEKVKHIRAGMMKKVVDVVNSEVNRLVGFEVFHQTKYSFEIKSISAEQIEDFETVLRRIFLLTLDYYADFREAIEKREKRPSLSLMEKPDSLVKFISYASRLLNKRGYAKYDYSPFLYHLIESLELISDCMKNALRFALNNDVKMTNYSRKIMDEIGECIQIYYDAYYKFSFEDFSKYIYKREDIINEINSSMGKMSKGELAAIIQLRMILDLIRESLRIRASLI